ncbi:pumilio homolog 4 [Euphorbia lathyris]|uniref:pumilio homolog 4 n=1 Tax=Euphorbia lathyris TaxID=212925 RepID=UPI003313CA26
MFLHIFIYSEKFSDSEMVTGSNIDMLLSLDDHLQGPNGNLENHSQTELELILQAHRNHHFLERERDLNIYRSGSAPPTVEGSLSAVGSLLRNPNFSDISSPSNNVVLTDDEIRSHPAYLSYYYSHDNMNPRLPPPLLSKEDWRIAQRFQVGGPSSIGGTGDLRKKKLIDEVDGSSLFSLQPVHSVQKLEDDFMELRNTNRNALSLHNSVGWLDRTSGGLAGSQGAGLGSRRKSFADILQEGLDRSAALSGHLSRPASHNAFGDLVGTTGIANPRSVGFGGGLESLEGLHSRSASPGSIGVQNHGMTVSHSFALGSSLSRSTTPEHQLVGRSSSSGLPPVGSRVGPLEKKSTVCPAVHNGHSSGMTELGEITATLSSLNLSKLGHSKQDVNIEVENQPDFLFNTSSGHNHLHQQIIEKSNAENLSFPNNYIDVATKNGIVPNLSASDFNLNGEVSLPKRTSSFSNLHPKANALGIGGLERSNGHHKNASIPSRDFAGHVAGAYSINQKLDSVLKNHLDEGSALRSNGIAPFNGVGSQAGPDLLSPVMDSRYTQYPRTSNHSTHTNSQVRNCFSTPRGNLDMIQKAYLEALIAQQNQQYESALVNSSSLNQVYHRNSSYGHGMPYVGNAIANPVLPSVASGSFQNEQVGHFTSMMRNPMVGSIGTWHPDVGNNMERSYTSSLLDEFKNNKARSFELSDIIDHVVEFSTDQYGSRFIQQKLETATVEEKNKIFPEIIPHARTLMTDVFGNYVIQKFFEHGRESHRTELASQLAGHVLPLSLQMYGCRVIQKALEVVDVDQQTKMVAELDGSVMKCVRDQNGNHVIQKCIECVPEHRIQFIISSFYGQVVTLSTHPYGCRVIQRVLEHSGNLNTQKIIIDEIMQSVCILAQDQYGNYVIQHVLEHGKLHERSAIINQLAGQIVKMSQQKFASNVVEKCLSFGGPKERQILVTEMLGSTDENEPLQVMMKDPFGNYVVQKVLETCDDRSLELILSRIKVHLTALKRYTYGKHIVSRVEKLIATGERRIGMISSFSS